MLKVSHDLANNLLFAFALRVHKCSHTMYSYSHGKMDYTSGFYHSTLMIMKLK